MSTPCPCASYRNCPFGAVPMGEVVDLQGHPLFRALTPEEQAAEEEQAAGRPVVEARALDADRAVAHARCLLGTTCRYEANRPMARLARLLTRLGLLAPRG